MFLVNGDKIQIRTTLRLNWLKIMPKWGEKDHFPSSMEAEIELLPFGHDNYKGNHKMLLVIPLPDDIKRNLEESVKRELTKFLEIENAKCKSTT